MKSFNRRTLLIATTLFILLTLGTAGFAATPFEALQESFASFFGFEATAASTQAEAAPAMFTIGVCDTAGPIEVEASLTGPGPTAYATLGAAFTAINAGTHTGAISIEVCGDTNELTTSAVLNASGSGSASYSVIIMRPSGGAARTISGNPAGPLIDLNGADNVTINGINTGGDSLTIENTLSASTPSAIRFIADATGNTVQNSTIKSAETSTTLGTIFFSTGTTTGNDSNIITNNTITSSGANFATNAIYSSGTSTAIDNGSIQITNNNISDYFNAASVTAGINVGATGNSGWTITGNKLFQSATRIYTTANTHNGILVGGGQGYTISNNTIGFANSAGTGTTSMVGNTVALTGTFPSSYTTTGTANATRYIAINTTFTAAGTVSNIQNNTIAGFALYTSSGATTTNGIWCGIQVLSGNANIGTTTGNTIGTASSSIYTAATTAGALIAPIYATSTNTVSIQNNTIQNLDAMGTTASSSGSVNGINTAGSAGNFNVSGNTIGNSTNPNIRMGTLQTGANLSNTGTTFGAGTGASIFRGILNAATGTVVIGTAALPNTIRNANINSTSTSARAAGIETTSGTNTIDSNSISNLTTVSGITNANATASMIGISLAVTGLTHSITTNTIRDLSNTSGTAAVTVTGIYIGGTPGTTITRNFLYNLTTASTSTSSVINGINLFNSAAIINIYNNMMRLGLGVGNNPIIRGVYDNTATSSPTNIIHNSIYIDGTQGANTVNTACIKKDLASTMTITDNILWNNRASTGAPGTNTGRHYGIQMVSAAGNPTSNYNDIYTPNNGGTIGLASAGTDQVTLANWRTATSQDLNSQNSDPKFVDATNATAPDLHINPSVTTLVEGNGILVSPPTDDFDGQTRSTLTPVDIGADAGNFTGVDLTMPAINYTTLGNTTNTTSRVLTISVTDASGVPTAGVGRPVLYYRKGTSGAYTAGTCVFTAGSSYDCTFTFASVGGVIAGDTIQYFVAAQDGAATPNVTSNPSTGASGFTANPPAASTPTTAPNSFLISASVAGTKTVCASGCDYTTLTGAGGVFSAINTGVATANIEIQIGGDLTVGEDGTNALNTLAEEPTGSNFTIKIYPTGTARNITGSNSGGLIRLNAADRVTIDGSIGGTGTDRSLNITQTNTGTSSAVVWLQSNSTDGATNNTIKNINVIGNSNTTTLVGIGAGSSTVSASSLGTNNNTNTIQNNNISKVQYGIYSQGAAIGTKNTGNTITKNLMNTASPNHILKSGILTGFENNLTISENTISNIAGVSSSYAWGISLGLTATTATTTTGNEVTNATVTRNIIGSVRPASTFGVAGIMVASAATGTNAITNNVIYDANTNGTSGDIGAGIYIGGGAGTTQIYFNSVQMAGTLTGGAYPSFAVAINGSNPIVDMRNNILTSTGSTGANLNRAIGLAYATFTNLTSNNNDLFVSGTSAAVGQTVNLTNSGATSSTTLANWQTLTSKDASSISANPQFNSATNLQPQTGSPVVGAGVFGTGILTDILGTIRATGAPPAGPTIGAYENTIDTAGPVITYTALGNTTSTSDRTLSITVTDTSGVPTSGAGLPVLYFRKGTSGAYTASTCSFVSGSSYSCSTNYAAVGGVAPSDTVQYYVAAQDNLNNVSTNPSTGAGGLTANPPAAATPPTTPSSYLISVSYTGTLNVDAAGGGGAYTSLTNAGGLFQALNNGVLTGNIIINLNSDLTGETGAITLNQQAEEGAGAGTYTVTIKPTGAARSITSTSTAAGLIGLLGADRVTIDGSLSGGTDRSLTLINSNTTTSGTSVIAVYSLGAGLGATNNTIKNCVIQNGNRFQASTTSFNFGIYVGGNGVAAGADNDNTTIQNNLIQRANTGMQVIGGASPNANDNLVIADNTVGGAVAADFIGLNGMIIGNANGAGITRNTVRNILFTEALDGAGILLSSGVVNSSVTRNTVTNLEASNSGGYGMTGIYIATATAASNDTIANNVVSDIRGTSWTTAVLGDTVVGIRVAGANTGGLNIYNNSVNLYGNYAGASGSATITAAFMVNATTPTNLNVRNNIFLNSFANTASTTDASYAVYTSSAATMFSAIDYNDYHTVGTHTVAGMLNGSPANSPSQFAAITGGDANSLVLPPLFTAPNDLHISYGSPAKNAGVTIATVTDDIDGNTRPQDGGYDMGADEFVDGNAPTIQIDSNPTNPSNSNSATFTFSGTDSFAPEAIGSYECQIDGGGYSSCTSPVTYNSLADGSHTFNVRSKDNSNNTSAPASYTWVVDTTPPVIVPDAPFQAPYTNSTSSTFTFHGTDSGSGIAGFICSLDGAAFAPCTSPVNFTGLSVGLHTFDVKAVDAAGNLSVANYSSVWEIDQTPPETSIDSNPPSQSAGSSAAFTFSGTDTPLSPPNPMGPGLTFECSLDSAPFASCTSPQNFSGLADGSHTFQVRTIDRAGNPDPTPASYTWTIDTAGPTVNITSSPNDPTQGTTAAFNFTGNDGSGTGVASYECEIDGGGYAACSSGVSYPVAEGPHTFHVRAIDTVGNVGAPASFSWRVDVTAPDTTINSNPTNPTTSASATFTFTGTDPGGFTGITFECNLDSAGYAPCTSGVSYSSLADGSHTFLVRAIDAALNVDASPASYTWLIDTAAPDTTITSQPSNPTNSQSAAFAFTGNDGGGSGVVGFECQVDGQGYNPCNSGTLNIGGLNSANHTVNVRAKDALGNVDPTPATYTWLVDADPPITTLDSQPTNPTNSNSATFTFHGNDPNGGDGQPGSGPSSFECKLDGGSFAACTSGVSYSSLTDGMHTFQVRGTDIAGNTNPTPVSYTWQIDTTAPTTTITASPSNPSNDPNASFSFTGNDGSGVGVATFECQLDGGGYTACTSPKSYAGLADGSHTFNVRAKDALGNTDATPETYMWTINTEAPDTNIVTNPANPTNSNSATFTYSGTDSRMSKLNPEGVSTLAFECSLDGAAFTSCSASGITYNSLSDGSHNFQVRARDQANNVDPSPASYTWTIDTTAPETNIATNPGNPSNSATATFTFNSSDGSGVGGGGFECQLDLSAWTTCTSGVSYPGLAEGSHTFSVRALDSLGNTDASPDSFTWLVDLTGPAITYTPLGNTTSTAARTQTATVTDALSPVANVLFTYYINGAGGTVVVCTLNGPNTYDCAMPGQPAGTAVSFNLTAFDFAGNATELGYDLYTVGAAAVPNGTYSHISLYDASSIGVAVTVVNNLDLNGIVTTGANSLHLGCNATVTGAGANSYVNGNVEHQFCSTGTYLFPVGTAPNGAARGNDKGADGELQPEGLPGEYSPVTVTVNSFSGTPSLKIGVSDTWLPQLVQTSALSRYWNVEKTNADALNVDMTFQYLNEDVYGNEALYKVFRRSDGFTTQYLSGSINAAANTFTATNVSTFSGWGAGQAVSTAASADISGRVLTADGRPIANVRVVITGPSLPEPISAYTGHLGYYGFNDLPVGENYIITVKSRRYQFANGVRVITLNEDLSGFDFLADPQE